MQSNSKAINNHRKKKAIIASFALGAFFLVSTLSKHILHLNNVVWANMASDNYEIQYDNINMTSGEKTKEGAYTITDTVGQTAPGEYSKNGYVVKSGFQYVYAIGNFGFSLSNTTIDLGILSSESFSNGSTEITVSTRGGGFIVRVYETSPLKHSSGVATIPDATCDNGSCTEGVAAVWINPAIEGFGYTLSGTGIPTAFVNTTYFKQFADGASSEQPQIVMSSEDVAINQKATLTVRAAASGNQAAGNYSNSLIFIATPGY